MTRLEATQSVVRRVTALAQNERLDYHRIGFELVSILGTPGQYNHGWTADEQAAIHAALGDTA